MDYNKYMLEAYYQASRSEDPSSQNGAVCLNRVGDVHLSGYNCFNEYLKEINYTNKLYKYHNIQHAEFLATLRHSYPYHLISPWAACLECARMMAFSGVRFVVRHKQRMEHHHERWAQSIIDGDTVLRNHGVEIIELDAFYNKTILIHGERVTL